jgi:hypothetical protein
MRLFDPDRPTNSRGQSQLTYGGMVPNFTVTPVEGGMYKLLCFLNTEDMRYAPFSALIRAKELERWFEDFQADPEVMLKKHFKFSGPGTIPEPTKTTKMTKKLHKPPVSLF